MTKYDEQIFALLKRLQPVQEQRFNPKCRLRQEMLPSIPARKSRSLRYTQVLLTMVLYRARANSLYREDVV